MEWFAGFLLGGAIGIVAGSLVGFFAVYWWAKSRVMNAQATAVGIAKDKATSFVTDQFKKVITK